MNQIKPWRLWDKFLNEKGICYNDIYGNRSCDNGAHCEKCYTEHIQKDFENWKEER